MSNLKQADLPGQNCCLLAAHCRLCHAWVPQGQSVLSWGALLTCARGKETKISFTQPKNGQAIVISNSELKWTLVLMKVPKAGGWRSTTQKFLSLLQYEMWEVQKPHVAVPAVHICVHRLNFTVMSWVSPSHRSIGYVLLAFTTGVLPWKISKN